MIDIKQLEGLTFTKIEGLENGSEKVIFYTTTGDAYWMFHPTICCEYVYIESVDGEEDDFIGTKIIEAEESFVTTADVWDSDPAVFYKLRTEKGYMTIRWYGCSSEYYSVEVIIEKVCPCSI